MEHGPHLIQTGFSNKKLSPSYGLQGKLDYNSYLEAWVQDQVDNLDQVFLQLVLKLHQELMQVPQQPLRRQLKKLLRRNRTTTQSYPLLIQLRKSKSSRKLDQCSTQVSKKPKTWQKRHPVCLKPPARKLKLKNSKSSSLHQDALLIWYENRYIENRWIFACMCMCTCKNQNGLAVIIINSYLQIFS